MSNMNTAVTASTPVNPSLAALQAKIAELEAALKAKATRAAKIGHSEYGKGTVTISGFGKRPFSFYPAHLRALIDGKILDKALEYAESHKNELRAAAFAAEFCEKSGVVWDARPNSKNESYKTSYKAAYEQAMKDPSLVSSKYRE